ncbi:MAG TPA: hypothetical protein VNH83_28950 [Bryobacteraceae bacterium]|nr:hypothetical protein [Bryobacteraceae bacterium]
MPATAPVFPLRPAFPNGDDPETFQIDAVNSLIRKAAYFTIFTVPDASRPNVPIFSPDGQMIGVEVNEELHRFDIRSAMPQPGEGIRVSNQVGEPIANVHIRWMPCPDDFEGAPGKTPPPTPLDPTRSQRFIMLDGSMRFRDRDESGFLAFGAGRTLPMLVDGAPQLGIGSVIETLEGFGKLRGLEGTNIVNGYINPPNGLVLSFMLRFSDPCQRLLASREISPIEPIQHPAPETVILAFLGETDRDTGTLNLSPDGRVLGYSLVERLRLVHISFDTQTRHGMRSSLIEGPVVGSFCYTSHFNPLDPRPLFPIYTTRGSLQFFDSQGRVTGGIHVNIEEGRAFRTELPGVPMPVFRLGGLGPLGAGFGQFAGATGMMTLNACVSAFPPTRSSMYELRINDRDGRFRASFRDAWM